MVSPAPARDLDSATVVLTWELDPRHVARPTNPGERFIFAQLYEPLVRTDCTGRPNPGLAASWTIHEGGAHVRLVLRDSARFWNGDQATAHDVIASWTATAQQPWAILARRAVRHASAIDDRTVEIACDEGLAQGSAPRRCELLAALGDPELAIFRQAGGASWLEGTGPYRPREPATRTSAASRRAPLLLEPTGSTTRTRIAVHGAGAADARDLIDAGLDLLLTDDPALASYASARSELAAISLEWDRTWVLMTPSARALAPDSVLPPTVELRSALARDVVPADARAAAWPEWWREASACTPEPSAESVRATGQRPRVAARANEPIARALAERLVALAAGRPPSAQDSALAVLAPQLRHAGAPVTAVALAPDAFESALRGGGDVAYVVPLPRRSVAPCIELARLRALAPWLVGDTTHTTLGAHVAPLIETRLRAVVRRSGLALTTMLDGTPLVALP